MRLIYHFWLHLTWHCLIYRCVTRHLKASTSCTPKQSTCVSTPHSTCLHWRQRAEAALQSEEDALRRAGKGASEERYKAEPQPREDASDVERPTTISDELVSYRTIIMAVMAVIVVVGLTGVGLGSTVGQWRESSDSSYGENGNVMQEAAAGDSVFRTSSRVLECRA